MNTISAKELRDNLANISKRVQRGEHIRVTYRNKLAFTLTPDAPTGDNRAEPGSRKAINDYLQRVNDRKRKTGHPVFDSEKSVKELYHEMLRKDSKYTPPHQG